MKFLVWFIAGTAGTMILQSVLGSSFVTSLIVGLALGVLGAKD